MFFNPRNYKYPPAHSLTFLAHFSVLTGASCEDRSQQLQVNNVTIRSIPRISASEAENADHFATVNSLIMHTPSGEAQEYVYQGILVTRGMCYEGVDCQCISDCQARDSPRGIGWYMTSMLLRPPLG